MPGLVGKWRENWVISCPDRMWRAVGKGPFAGVELATSSPLALDEELTALERQ
jgi:hypothetical protein